MSIWKREVEVSDTYLSDQKVQEVEGKLSFYYSIFGGIIWHKIRLLFSLQKEFTTITNIFVILDCDSLFVPKPGEQSSRAEHRIRPVSVKGLRKDRLPNYFVKFVWRKHATQTKLRKLLKISLPTNISLDSPIKSESLLIPPKGQQFIVNNCPNSNSFLISYFNFIMKFMNWFT